MTPSGKRVPDDEIKRMIEESLRLQSDVTEEDIAEQFGQVLDFNPTALVQVLDVLESMDTLTVRRKMVFIAALSAHLADRVVQPGIAVLNLNDLLQADMLREEEPVWDVPPRRPRDRTSRVRRR